MSEPKRIEVTVSPTGETTVQTRGFRGAECKIASASLEKALGVARADRPTGEMYEPTQGQGLAASQG